MNYNRRDFIKKTGAGMVAMTFAGSNFVSWAAEDKKKKPNIILFLTDDQGWTDTSVQMMAGRPDSKSDFYQTPNLERLAREGMRFSNGYTPAPVCGPTRQSIQFGKTPARQRHSRHWKSCEDEIKNEISIPQMIKSANPNYVAAHFGKWGTVCTPKDEGYDISDGPTGNGNGDWRDGKALLSDNPKRIFGITRRANDFMEEQVKAGLPFYMQLSHYAAHVSHMALKKTIEKYKKLPRGKKCTDADYQSPPPLNAWSIEYAAMIDNLDAGLGMLLDKIDELDIADNTYIIFFSDNGGGFRGNEPLKGGKASLWEGGIRVPMVVRGPGIKPGSFCDVPVAGWDFFPTISDLIGNKNPLPKGIDGGSLRPLFENGGKGKVRRPYDYLVWHYPSWSIWGASPMSAIRQDDYKLVKKLDSGEIFLFNLADDIEESRNLAPSMAKKAKELNEKMTHYLKTVQAEDWKDIRKEVRPSQERIEKERREKMMDYLKRVKAENADELRRKIDQLEKQLKQLNKKVRESFRSQKPDAKDNHREASGQRLILNYVKEKLEERLRQRVETKKE